MSQFPDITKSYGQAGHYLDAYHGIGSDSVVNLAVEL
jgi:hypothetical protein